MSRIITLIILFAGLICVHSQLPAVFKNFACTSDSDCSLMHGPGPVCSNNLAQSYGENTLLCGCRSDADCSKHPFSQGNVCVNGSCGCRDSNDCGGNSYGSVCSQTFVPGWNICGCNTPNDCPDPKLNGYQCQFDNNTGVQYCGCSSTTTGECWHSQSGPACVSSPSFSKFQNATNMFSLCGPCSTNTPCINYPKNGTVCLNGRCGCQTDDNCVSSDSAGSQCIGGSCGCYTDNDCIKKNIGHVCNPCTKQCGCIDPLLDCNINERSNYSSNYSQPIPSACLKGQCIYKSHNPGFKTIYNQLCEADSDCLGYGNRSIDGLMNQGILALGYNCYAGKCICLSNSDCVNHPRGPFCNTTTQTCGGAPSVCSGLYNFCSNSSSGSRCIGNGTCGCYTNDDCLFSPNGSICDTFSNTCVGCFNSTDCANSTRGPICRYGLCGCANSSDCSRSIFGNLCIFGVCGCNSTYINGSTNDFNNSIANFQCNSSRIFNKKCINFHCGNCISSSNCSGSTPRCLIPQNLCGCLNNQDCKNNPFGPRCAIHSAGNSSIRYGAPTCGPCLSSSDCIGHSNGSLCIDGVCGCNIGRSDCPLKTYCNFTSSRCQQCLADSHCRSYQECKKGRCVAKDCNNDKDCSASSTRAGGICKDGKCEDFPAENHFNCKKYWETKGPIQI